jgi:transposase InsO family protein
MELANYAVNAVLVEGRSVRDVAKATGTSKSWVHRHVQLYRNGGAASLAPCRRGPKHPPALTSSATEDEIVWWRKHLAEAGFDAGARTIHYHLSRSHLQVPSLSTIHRVLRRRGFVEDQPQKRPRSSWVRFEAALPNECWQTDMTHWPAAKEPAEILHFIDDCSRAVLGSRVVRTATAACASELFYEAVATWGLPASVLSDNGAIYTAHYRGASTGLEIDLAALGIAFKHGKPYHPQTQGKIERYHQTLKKWLTNKDAFSSIAELQQAVDFFAGYYNEIRPHQAHGRPPLAVYKQRDKASPVVDGQPVSPTTKVRRDRVDYSGTVTLRHRSKLHHIGIGRQHKSKRVLMLVCDLDVRIVDDLGTVLRHLTLDPTKDYQPMSRASF